MSYQAKKGRILIVDDEVNGLKVLQAILSEDGYEVMQSLNCETAIEMIQKDNPDLVITDFKMPGMDGMHLFEYIQENHQDIPVIFLSAYGTVDSAVHAMQSGAFYFFEKPPDYIKLKSMVFRAVEQRRLKQEVAILRQKLSELPSHQGENEIIGNSAKTLDLIKTINTIKDSKCSILITGETGTGKELVARALHYKSKTADSPFIAVNCAAIPRELIEAEIFGYEKGAFTGAFSRRIGKFEEAKNGTMFLDEIGELEPSLQAKLLRVLQEKEIERIGGREKIKVDFRLICSTNRNLLNEINAGNFREDLLYRINVFHIRIPPLRQRKEDIPLLVSKFLGEFCEREKKTVTLDSEAIDLFLQYNWPGNIRQLRNVVERAIVIATNSHIRVKDLPEELKKSKCNIVAEGIVPLKRMEFHTVRNAMAVCKGNKSKAARALGISRKALYSRLNELRYQA